MNELERYISDDILRNGNRLADLEKKLLNAYEEAVGIMYFFAIFLRTDRGI